MRVCGCFSLPLPLGSAAQNLVDEMDLEWPMAFKTWSTAHSNTKHVLEQIGAQPQHFGLRVSWVLCLAMRLKIKRRRVPAAAPRSALPLIQTRFARVPRTGPFLRHYQMEAGDYLGIARLDTGELAIVTDAEQLKAFAKASAQFTRSSSTALSGEVRARHGCPGALCDAALLQLLFCSHARAHVMMWCGPAPLHSWTTCTVRPRR